MNARALEVLFAVGFVALGLAVVVHGVLAGKNLSATALGLIFVPSLLAMLPRWRDSELLEALRIVAVMPPLERVGLMWIFAVVYLALGVFGASPSTAIILIGVACALSVLWVMLWPYPGSDGRDDRDRSGPTKR